MKINLAFIDKILAYPLYIQLNIQNIEISIVKSTVYIGPVYSYKLNFRIFFLNYLELPLSKP
jgi:hypothetical protein